MSEFINEQQLAVLMEMERRANPGRLLGESDAWRVIRRQQSREDGFHEDYYEGSWQDLQNSFKDGRWESAQRKQYQRDKKAIRAWRDTK